jgi:Winged helix DNA-binding domain
MLTITAEQRRARLVRRHRIDASAPSVLDATRAMVVLHATDPATVYLSALARVRAATLDDVSDALYVEGTLLRLLAMRRTLFVSPTDFAPVVHHAASTRIAADQRKTLLKQLDRFPTDPVLIGDLDAWLCDVEQSTERALLARAEATANQLTADEPRLRTAILPTSDKSYDVRRNVTSQVLVLMGAEGRIVRARPRGAWTSRQHTWAPAASVWPDGMPELDPAGARATLVRRWLEVFGPATVADVKWWTGWPLGLVRTAIAALETVEVDLDGQPGIVLADDLEPVPVPRPAAALLPALDPTPMGWQQRDWFLGPHRQRLFDSYGNIGPTVWWGGRIVGGWAVARSGELRWKLLEDVGEQASAAVAEAAARLESRMAGAVVVPSFRTPLERELSA